MHLKRFITTKEVKNTYGYLRTQRVYELAKALLLFALAAGIYALGYISTKSNKNLLTIVAVLGCLPASRSAVNMIMVLRFKGIKDADFAKIRPHVGGCASLCDMVFTSYERNYEIHHMAFKGNSLIGFTANPDCDAKGCEKHLHALCVQNNLADVDIRIFKELPKYINRLDQMQELPDYEISEEQKTPVPKAEVVCALLRAISL